MKDYYYILGVTRTASPEEIRRAYRKLSVKFHPDKNDGDAFFEDRFKEINEAYEVLGNASRRQQHDGYPFSQADDTAQTNTQKQYFSPRIISFTADRKSVAIGEAITYYWQTEYATLVELKPFGKVPRTGQKTIKVLGFNQPNGLKTSLEVTNDISVIAKTHLVANRQTNQKAPLIARGGKRKGTRATELLKTFSVPLLMLLMIVLILIVADIL